MTVEEEEEDNAASMFQSVTLKLPRKGICKKRCGTKSVRKRGRPIKIIRWNKHENKRLLVNQAELRPHFKKNNKRGPYCGCVHYHTSPSFCLRSLIKMRAVILAINLFSPAQVQLH